MKISWMQLAKDNIELFYICPICQFSHNSKHNVEYHIDQKHTIEEIKRICSE